MVFGDFLARRGGGHKPEESAVPESSGPPTGDALRSALDRTEELVTGGSVPSTVTARVLRVTAAVRDTLPRLDQLGAGSASAYNVMATATDYLPDAVNGYLRLPRRFADTRPVDGGRTSLMVLVDQLDLLGATMDRVFDAVYRSDANALVAHGRFLQEKFGRGTVAGTGNLVIGEGETAVPAPPAAPESAGEAATAGGAGGAGEVQHPGEAATPAQVEASPGTTSSPQPTETAGPPAPAEPETPDASDALDASDGVAGAATPQAPETSGEGESSLSLEPPASRGSGAPHSEPAKGEPDAIR